MTEPIVTLRLSLGESLSLDWLCDLLAEIDSSGSLSKAAARRKLSYRHAWGAVKRAEQRLGQRLLVRRTGGADGGGATLTEHARELLSQYARYRAQLTPQVEQIFAASDDNPLNAKSASPLLVASTIGPVETGLLPALEEAYLAQTGVVVRHIAAGSGQALRIARKGNADLVLTHALSLEESFIADGYGARRYPLMSNTFLILGPAQDPARVGDARSAAGAFRRIASCRAAFVSRGDESGTHVKELLLWQKAGVTPRAPWHRAAPQGALGSLSTLRHAEMVQGYALVDRATYLIAAARGLSLVPLLSGDPALRNEFALIPISPARVPHAAYEGAMRFVQWATGARGQAVVVDFGVREFGESLFVPAGKATAAASHP
jgi:tungstate transport system substrate-binding protein